MKAYYVADDGTEFEDEAECLEYERLQNEEIMYDIDRFVKEKIGIIFNTKEEMNIFQRDCENYNKSIDFGICFLDRELSNTYVICWNGKGDLTIRNSTGRYTRENLDFFSGHGWKIIDANELMATVEKV